MITEHFIRNPEEITDSLELVSAYVIPKNEELKTGGELVYVFKSRSNPSNFWYEYNWKSATWHRIDIIPQNLIAINEGLQGQAGA